MFNQTILDRHLIIFGQFFLTYGGSMFVDEDHRLDFAAGGEIIYYVDTVILRNEFLSATWNVYNVRRVDFYTQDLRNIVRIFN